MAAVSQLPDRSSPLAAQFFGKRALLVRCGGQKPVGPSRNQVWAEPEAVAAGFWADKWHSIPDNLAVTAHPDTSTQMFEDLVDKVRWYIDSTPKLGQGFHDPVQDVLIACQQGANRPSTAEEAHVETNVAHNMACKLKSTSQPVNAKESYINHVPACKINLPTCKMHLPPHKM